MKQIVVISIISALMALNCHAQEKCKWDNLSWLTGEWQGEGNGQPGNGGGRFSFSFDLEKNILVRKSHSEYISNENHSVTVHEDLMIIYSAPDGSGLKAVYFDNEGHIINYQVSGSEKTVTFISEKQGSNPSFRLIYTLLDPVTVNVRFEISADGINFRSYIEGNSRKILKQ